MNLLDLDARWLRFNDDTRACPCCGQTFSGVFDIGFEEPDDWPHGPRTSDDTNIGDDRLTPDLCRLNGRYFLRATLPLPLRGADEALNISLWIEVSRDTLHAYLDTFDAADPGDGTATFDGTGLTANSLPGFDADMTPVTLHAADATQRPMASATDGPLAQAQADGISFDDLLDIYADSGTDIRPHLTA